jgi:hypothetical protein
MLLFLILSISLVFELCGFILLFHGNLSFLLSDFILCVLVVEAVGAIKVCSIWSEYVLI